MEKKYLFTITVMFCLFCSCSDTDNWAEEAKCKTLSVAQVGFSLKSADRPSKSFFEEGDEIGLYIYGPGGTGNNKLTYKNSYWALQTPVSLFENDTNIHATYPYIPDNTDPFHFVIEHTSQTDYLYSDRLSATAVHPEVYLSMKHALALIEFEFEQEPMTGNKMIDFISINGWGLYSKAQVDLLSGKVEYVSELREPAIIYGWQMENPFIGYGNKISLMVVPVREVIYNGDISFNMLIGSSKYHWPVPAGTTWEGGKKYTYKVHIQERMLEVISVHIEDWSDAGKEKIHLPYYD